jgi:hypothetical protein
MSPRYPEFPDPQLRADDAQGPPELVGTVSVTRMKKDKLVQTGKVLVTSALTITGLGCHAGSGEDWADEGNTMTAAEAQAFKLACSCFGLGRYLHNFAEMWVPLNEYRQPSSSQSSRIGRCPRATIRARRTPRLVRGLQQYNEVLSIRRQP